MSTLTVQNLQGVSPTNMIRVPTGHKIYSPGSVVQVVQTVKSDVFSSSSTTFIDLTGMTVTITPTLATSRILVEYSVQTSIVNGGFGCVLKLQRNGSDLSGALGVGVTPVTTMAYSDATSASGYPVYNQTAKYLDSPSTTSILTYKLQIRGWVSSAGTFVVNRSFIGNDTNLGTGISTITVTEIAQ